MGAKENFSLSLTLDTDRSIRSRLVAANSIESAYKSAIEALEWMELRFNFALGKNPYDYFDGEVLVDVDKTEFEKKARELNLKMKKLHSEKDNITASGSFAQSKFKRTLLSKQELDALVLELLETQEKAKKQVENDIKNGKLVPNADIFSAYNTRAGLDYRITRVSSQLRSLDRGSKPLASIIDIHTQGGEQFSYSYLDDYNPQTTSEKIEVTNSKIKTFLEKSLFKFTDNIKNTQPEKLKKWLENYFIKNPDILKKYKIGDYKNLTPKQAIQLTSEIVRMQMEYDYEQAKVDAKSPNDDKSVDKLLEDGKGVCRNYTYAVKAVFDSLKSMQDLKHNQLQNTYVNLIIDFDFLETSYYRGDFGKNWLGINQVPIGIARNVRRHMRNTFYTVTSPGKIEGVIVDVTSAEKKPGFDAGNDRIIFELERMVTEGLITQEQKIVQLEKWLEGERIFQIGAWIEERFQMGDYYLKRFNYSKGLEWYFKFGSIEGIEKAKKRFNIPQQVINSFIEKNLHNPLYGSKFTEYYYKNGNFSQCIDVILKIGIKEWRIDQLIMLVYSCMQCGDEKVKMRGVNYFSRFPEIILKANTPEISKKYPKEIKAIMEKYGKKTK